MIAVTLDIALSNHKIIVLSLSINIYNVQMNPVNYLAKMVHVVFTSRIAKIKRVTDRLLGASVYTNVIYSSSICSSYSLNKRAYDAHKQCS